MPYGGRIRGSGRPLCLPGAESVGPSRGREKSSMADGEAIPIAEGGRPVRDPDKPGSQAVTGLFLLVVRLSPLVL